MHTIEVEQAVFASSDHGTMKGYQLVAKSAGIDREISGELCRWSPTSFSNDPSKWALNVFPVSQDLTAVTRTVLGGPEYSNRGALQIVTSILLPRLDQLEHYDFDGATFAKTALAMGNLRLPLDLEIGELPKVILPDRPIVDPDLASIPREKDENLERLLDKTSKLIIQSRRVALVGLQDHIDAVSGLLIRLPVPKRKAFSFTTGLTPSVRRPFQAHFLDHVEPKTQRVFDSQDIVVLDSHDDYTVSRRQSAFIPLAKKASCGA